MKRFHLNLIRKSRRALQVDIARTMRVSQSAVSKLESRGDVALSALRDYVRAMGGELEVVARFPDAVYPISTRDLGYAERAPLRRVRERSPEGPSDFHRADAGSAPVVAPEWLAEVDRIRAMTPAARLQELRNGAAFFAAAKRLG
jgi:hypothetical protein